MAQKERFTVKAKNDGTTSVAKNPLIEKLTRTHIAVPVTLYFILSAGLLYYAVQRQNMNPLVVTGLFFGGWLFFSLLEYIMHRWLFHMSIHTKFRKNLQYTAHGVHHEFPKDKTRLAMPVPASLVLASAFFSVFWVIMNVYTFGFLPGVLTGYATYLFVHFIVHIYAPPKNYFKHLWLSHSIHHYKDNTVVFGVSSQLWDHIFGTMPKKAA
ncbi:MAG: sterol desaturase family protein [Cyclobacteriaceae bacterium]